MFKHGLLLFLAVGSLTIASCKKEKTVVGNYKVTKWRIDTTMLSISNSAAAFEADGDFSVSAEVNYDTYTYSMDFAGTWDMNSNKITLDIDSNEVAEFYVKFTNDGMIFDGGSIEGYNTELEFERQ